MFIHLGVLDALQSLTDAFKVLNRGACFRGGGEPVASISGMGINWQSFALRRTTYNFYVGVSQRHFYVGVSQRQSVKEEKVFVAKSLVERSVMSKRFGEENFFTAKKFLYKKFCLIKNINKLIY